MSHFQIRFAGPLAAGYSAVHGRAASYHLIESHLARIALRDGIRGQQSSRATGLEQTVGAQEEISHVVRTSTLPARNVLDEVIAVRLAKHAR